MPEPKEFILDDSKWPHWPKLPLKRQKNGLTEHAVMQPVHKQSGLCRVYHVSLYNRLDSSTAFTAYANVELLLADGWVID